LQRPENSHLCAAVDEDGSVRIVDTSAPVRALSLLLPASLL